MRLYSPLRWLGVAWWGWIPIVSALEFPGPAPGAARGNLKDGVATLRNSILEYSWTVQNSAVRPERLTDRMTGQGLDLRRCELLRVTLGNGRTYYGSDFRLVDVPRVESVQAEKGASTLARRFGGRRVVARMVSPADELRVEWRAELRDGANAVRQEFEFLAQHQTLAVQEIRLVELPAEGTEVIGSVPGSPLVCGRLFFAYEHPDAVSGKQGSEATCRLAFNASFQPGQPMVQVSAAGVLPEGQRRRAFLYYVERERSHPYRPFLHYNAWYDICWAELKINEAQCLEVVRQLGQELISRRGVPLASMVWDDGWDDPRTLWQPIQANFPRGFGPVLAEARKCQSTLGFWLSPFGGYGKPAQDRLAMGKAEGFETGPQGFSLAGPKYYARFLETCSRFVQQDGANFFKFDGLARSVSETEAMLRLTRALRALRPDLFISITTGTWPSPFWLWYGDSTWRGGGDMGFHGAGSKREQWMTYRDWETYRGVVRPAPLYPLNSLMTQGIAHARHGSASECGQSEEELRREIRSFFASGTCLQELYITPSLLSARNWDDLAAAAEWAHRQADVLVDTHWVGGDPGRGEPYGWASWSSRLGVLALRNPSAQPSAITIDLGEAFELPRAAKRRYLLQSPWPEDRAKPGLALEAGVPFTFSLGPFEVAVWEARAR